MAPKKHTKKRRIKIGIRPQLIFLVCFSSLFSLLILAIVIGVYVSNIVSSLRADRLLSIALLKATQIKQSTQFIYYQIAWLSQRDSISSPLSYYRAGNYSDSVFSSAQSTLDLFLESSESFAAARLYNLDLLVVAESTNSMVNVSEPVEDVLYPLGSESTVPAAVFTSNSLNAIPLGYLAGPLPNNDSYSSNYFLSITMPVYANSSIILKEQLVTGYLTVLANAQTIRSSLQVTSGSEDYTSVAIEPIYQNSTTKKTPLAIIGFNLIFREMGMTLYANTFYAITQSRAAQEALLRGEGVVTNVKNFLGTKVAVGFCSIQMDSSTSWSVLVEQSQTRFSKPVKKLADIMVGVVIGIGVFMCLITFPLAVWFVIPITKLKNSVESINKSKKEKNLTGVMRATTHSQNSLPHMDQMDADGNPPKRNSVNTVSSGSSTVYSTGIRLPERIPQSKKLFKDELTELSDAFNIMTEELEKQYNHLEDRVRVRTKELEASKIEAEAANEAKTVFIANISHELRTPLNGILGMTSIAMEETDHTLIQDSLKLIHRSGELLLHILTELLTYSKNTLNRSKLEKSNFQILEVVHQVKSIFSKLAQDQRVHFNIILKPNILRKLILIGDSNRIIQVVMNLVSNSLKFTPVDGSVDVSIKLLGEYDPDASQKVNYEQVCIKKPFVEDEFHDASEQDNQEVERVTSNAHDLAYGPYGPRKDSIPNSLKISKVPTSASMKSLQNHLNDNTDNQSLVTLTTAEYEQNIFESQFSQSKPLPKTPDETEAKQLDQGAPQGQELVVKTDGPELNGSEPKRPPPEPLPNGDSRRTMSTTDISRSELVKGTKVFKLRKLYGPKAWVVQIIVKDTGSGIEPALQEKVFEPFIQGDQTLSRSYGGTGLGLSICRQLAKMMRGTLTLKSSLGKGSTFIFTLPLTQSGEIIVPPEDMAEYCEDEFNPKSKMNRKVLFDISDAAEPSSIHDGGSSGDIETSTKTSSPDESHLSAKSHVPMLEIPLQTSVGTVNQSSGDTCLDNLSHLRILVAEDNSVNQEVIRRMLKLEGFSNITMAANGAEAVDLVKKSYDTMQLYDIIFMDVQMPKMDGLTATKIIRKNLRYKKPIIALTAFADESNVKECLNCGMSGFLSKPIKRTNLRKIVTEISPDLLSDIVTTPNTFLEEEKKFTFGASDLSSTSQ